MFHTTEDFSKEIRAQTLKMIYNAKASHIGGAFSMADILAVLYHNVLNIDPNDPTHEGFFPMSILDSYSKDDSILLSHTSHKIPGVELSTGSLGHALGVACGVALAGKLKDSKWKVYALLSDGELDEGSNWEAILFAPQHELSNLTLIIDFNKIQSLGNVDEVINLLPLNEKFKSFNWNVIEIDGHDHSALQNAFTSKCDKRPTVIIANTVKGKGIDFMENKLLWHYKSPDSTQYSEGLKQIYSK